MYSFHAARAVPRARGLDEKISRSRASSQQQPHTERLGPYIYAISVGRESLNFHFSPLARAHATGAKWVSSGYTAREH